MALQEEMSTAQPQEEKAMLIQQEVVQELMQIIPPLQDGPVIQKETTPPHEGQLLKEELVHKVHPGPPLGVFLEVHQEGLQAVLQEVHQEVLQEGINVTTLYKIPKQ